MEYNNTLLSTIERPIFFGLCRPAFFVISFIAVAFGYWFAKNQVNAVYPDAFISYPLHYFILTIMKCYLTIIAFFALSQIVLTHLSLNKLTSLCIALTYFPLLFVYMNCPLAWVAYTVFILQACCLLFIFKKDDYQRLVANYGLDFLVLLAFFLLHLFLTSRFSPLHWNMAILAADGYYTDEALILAPIFRGFILAKQFSFSFIDHSQWAGIMHTPFLLNSPFLQFITLIFDLPSVSYESFHIALMTVNFILAIIGSFGFYLFLKYAAKVHKIFAIFGGFLFFFSGSPLLSQMLGADNAAFISSYTIFPYALLMITLAFEKKNVAYAAWAGVALASQLFFSAPHPEGVIYSFLFYCLYALGLVIYTRGIELRQRIRIASISVVAFLALSAFDYVPILADRFMGNMYVVAHIGDISATPLANLKRYIFILLAATPISFFFLSIKNKNKFSPVYLSSLLLSWGILFFLLLTTQVSLMNHLVKLFHVGLHFWYYWREGMYFCLSVFIIAIFALDQITDYCWQFIMSKYNKLRGSAI